MLTLFGGHWAFILSKRFIHVHVQGVNTGLVKLDALVDLHT